MEAVPCAIPGACYKGHVSCPFCFYTTVLVILLTVVFLCLFLDERNYYYDAD